MIRAGADVIKIASSGGFFSPADDPRQRKPDISKALELLGWEPKVPLSEGLDQTIAYFREQLNGATAVATE